MRNLLICAGLAGLAACGPTPDTAQTVSRDTAAATGAPHCAPDGLSHEALLQLKTDTFDTMTAAEKDGFAIKLTPCLADPHPDIRDGVAFETMSKWMREGAVSGVSLIAIRSDLYDMLDAPDADGFAHPFAALVLSEVARTDRVVAEGQQPVLSDTEFDNMVQRAAGYLSGVSDYRGFNNDEGWRHGTAHGADWALQLVLNPRSSKQQLETLRAAIASQVKAGGAHAYIHGEPDRLARPILYMAVRGDFTQSEWNDWLADVTGPAPMGDWSDAFASEAGLAQLHNVRAFIYALYPSANLSSNENVRALLPGLETALRDLP